MKDTLRHLLATSNDTSVASVRADIEDVAVPSTEHPTVISQLTPRAIAGIVLAIIIIIVGLVVSVRALYQKVTANKYNREDIRYSEILITDDGDDDHQE